MYNSKKIFSHNNCDIDKIEVFVRCWYCSTQLFCMGLKEAVSVWIGEEREREGGREGARERQRQTLKQKQRGENE